MKKLNKIFVFLVCAFAVLLLSLQYLLPKLINSELMKERIEKAASEKVGGRVTFEEIDLSIFPAPNAVIRKGRIKTEQAEGTVESLYLYVRLEPLLKGQFEVSELVLQSPDVNISVTSGGEAGRKVKPVTPGMIRVLLAPLALDMPDLVFSLEKGSFSFIIDDRTSYSVQDIYFSLLTPPAGVETVSAEIESSGGRLVIPLEGKEHIISASDMRGSFYYDNSNTVLLLNRLVLDDPDLRLEGELNMDNKGGRVSVHIKASDVDVVSIRSKILSLAGDAPLVSNIFEIVRAGSVPVITLESQGNSFSEVSRFDNMVINGKMSRGNIFIPGVDLDLQAVNGSVVISEGILRGKGLEASLGKARGEKGRLKVGLEGDDAPFSLDINVDADADELHLLLKRLIEKGALSEQLSLLNNVKGSLSGRLVLGQNLNNISPMVEVSEMKMSADYEHSPFPIEIERGSFFYNGSMVNVEKLAGRSGKSGFSDVSFRFGLNQGPFFNLSSATALIDMTEIYPWLAGLIDMPEKSFFRTSLEVSSLNFLWDRVDKRAFQGEVTFENGPDVSFDLHKQLEEFRVNRLAVTDSVSNAVLSMSAGKKSLLFKFKGKLSKATLDKVFVEKSFLKEEVSGDITLKLDRDDVLLSSAEGGLEGKGMVLPLNSDIPLIIEAFSMNASKGGLELRSADLLWKDRQFRARGSASKHKDIVLVSLDLLSGGVAWEEIRQAFGEKKEGGKKEGYLNGLPLKLVLNVHSDYLDLDKYRIEPFASKITIEAERIGISLKDAVICDVLLPGSMEVTPSGTSFDFQPIATDKDLAKSMECLFGRKEGITGTFDMKALVKAEGQGDGLFQSIDGTIGLNVKKGRIYRGGILAKILAFINVTEVFRGEPIDLVAKGFAYKSITGEGELKGHNIRVKEAFMDSSAMNMLARGDINIKENTIDMTVLVTPLKTVDSIIEKIPIIRDITGGTLISIPIKVTGDIDNPDLRYLPVKEVGARILEIMKNTLQVPFKVIEPIVQ